MEHATIATLIILHGKQPPHDAAHSRACDGLPLPATTSAYRDADARLARQVTAKAAVSTVERIACSVCRNLVLECLAFGGR